MIVKGNIQRTVLLTHSKTTQRRFSGVGELCHAPVRQHIASRQRHKDAWSGDLCACLLAGVEQRAV